MMAKYRVLVGVLLGVLAVQLVTGASTDEGPVDRDVQGPKGDPAPNQGNRGPPGRPGYPGIPGPKGEAGQGGLPGLDGMPGLPGRKGERGDYGDKGHEGHPGIKGQAGSPGLPGLPGLDGMKGQYGGKGHPGDTGMPGRPGSPGEPGFQGLNGMKGARGYKGGPCECGNPQTPRKRAVAFSAEVDNVPQPSLHSLPVPVTRIMADVGSWFQLNVSRFIAPSTGVYAFSLVTISEGSVAIPISLVHNGQEVMYTGRTDTSMGIYPVGANRIFLNLSRDDYVDVRVRPKEQGVVSSLADLFYSETRMTFLGYKLMY